MKRMAIMTAVLAMAGMAATVQAQDEYVLQNKQLGPGEARTLHTIAHIVGAIQGMGIGNLKMTQKVQQWMKMECLEVSEDGTTRIRIGFDRFAMEMDMAGKQVKFDSADPASAVLPSQDEQAREKMTKSMGGMYTGKGLTATVTAEGKCLKLEGLDEMFEGMKDMPGGEQMAKSIKESMSENLMKNESLGGNGWLPKKPVRIGEVWSSEQRMKMGPLGEVISKTRNKLLGVETIDGRRIARVGQTMNMEMNPDFGFMKMPGAENVHMKMITEGGTGTWLWDLDNGYMIKMLQNAPMEMSVEFGSTTQPSVSMGIKAKINYSSVAEIVGDEVAAKLLPIEMPKAPPIEKAKTMLDVGTTQPAATE